MATRHTERTQFSVPNYKNQIISRESEIGYFLPKKNQLITIDSCLIPVEVMSLSHNLCNFNDKNTKGNRSYIPFENGPISVIATRRGKLQAKNGLVFVLQKFSFELGETFWGSRIRKLCLQIFFGVTF